MKTYTSPAAFLRDQAEYFRHFEGTQIELHREMVSAGVQDHRELTSGTIPEATLRALGHPFGKTGAGRMRGATLAQRRKLGFKGSVPLLPINRQTGLLQSALTVTGPSGPDQKYSVGFDPAKAPYAPFILAPGGTQHMIPRGFFQELEKRNKARLHGQLLKARDAATKFPQGH